MNLSWGLPPYFWIFFPALTLAIGCGQMSDLKRDNRELDRAIRAQDSMLAIRLLAIADTQKGSVGLDSLRGLMRHRLDRNQPVIERDTALNPPETSEVKDSVNPIQPQPQGLVPKKSPAPQPQTPKETLSVEPPPVDSLERPDTLSDIKPDTIPAPALITDTVSQVPSEKPVQPDSVPVNDPSKPPNDTLP